ncbi:flagellar protein FlaG [Paenibacillus sp. GCM10027629]|uniref:flagellar protein FlaG n=1 Tax=Paenibacillus sp. GCM10027629 TaxID=3273414 RepID=UPI0036370983
MLAKMINPTVSSIRAQSSLEIRNSLKNSLTVSDNKDSNDRVLTSTELLHKRTNDLSISDAAFQKALEKVNKALNGVATRLEFNVHKSTGDVMVKVINAETNEVVREVPPEKIVDLVAKLEELSGLIIDEKR